MKTRKNRNGFRLGQFLGGLLLMSVLTAVAWFAGPMLWDSAAALSWPERSCRIERSEVKRYAMNDYRFSASYAYEVDGRSYSNTGIDTLHESTYRFRRVGERLPLLERYAPGKTATCRVNPANPFDAVLVVNPSSAALSALVPLVICLLGAVLGLSVMAFAFPRPRQAVASRWRVSSLLLAILGFMGFAFSLVGWTGVVWAGRSAVRLHVRTYVACIGEVIDKGMVRSTSSGSRRGGSHTVYGARIAYAYMVDGKAYECDYRTHDEVMSSDSGPAQRVLAAYAVGQAVEVWYDAKDPQEALLQRPEWSTGLLLPGFFLLFALAGSGMLAMLLVQLVRMRRGRPEPITACALPLKRTLPRDFGMTVVFAFFWNLFMLVAAGGLLSGRDGDIPWVTALFLMPFMGVGVFLVFHLVRTVLRFRLGAHVRVEVTAALLQAGADVQANWTLTGPRDCRALEVYVLQSDRGIRPSKSMGRADRSQKVADLKGGQTAGSFAFTLPAALESDQIRWELQFVFRGSHMRILQKDIFRLPM